MMKKLILSLFAGTFLLVQAVLASAATVTFNQFVEHPALDSIRKGIQDVLVEKGLDVKFILHNAQANMGTAGQIAKQQVGERADLIVGIATPSAQACVQAVEMAPEDLKRPVLFAGITDPLLAGLVKDLNHPGGFVTGTSDRLPLDSSIRMVREFIGPFKRLGFLYNASEQNSQSVLARLKKIAQKENFELIEATASKTADVYQAAKSLVGRVDAIFIVTDNTVVAALESLLKVGMQSKTPVFASDMDSVKRGAVAALGLDYYEDGRVAGEMAAKILGGANPGDMPVEFMKEGNLNFSINMKTVKALGLNPPKELLDKAVKVGD